MTRFTSGEEIGVGVAAIERELSSLWRQAGAHGSVVRACSWNLVLPAATEGAYMDAKRLVDEVVSGWPARALVVHLSGRDEGPDLEAWVSANCHAHDHGASLMCSEEVTIETSLRGAVHIPSLVRSLLVPQVPTALVWLDPSFPQASAMQLLPECNRLIVDSGRYPHLDPLADLLRLSATLPIGEVADLGWLRLGPLRLVLASSFDPPFGAGLLLSARRVRARCAAGSHGGARLIIGWLASRLQWPALISQGQGVFEARGERGTVKIEISDCGDRCGPTGIYSLELESSGGECLTISTQGPGVVSVTSSGLPRRMLATPERSDAALLRAALGSRGRDPLFPQALLRAVELEAAG